MARVKPFRAVRYHHPDGCDITELTAPPYDVISPAMRADLLSRDPHNVVALELPEGPLDPFAPNSRYDTGGQRWREWLTTGVLKADNIPSVYVLEQRYIQDGEPIARRGFIAAVGLEPFSAGVVLPHERTLPKAIDDRLNLTRSTAANLSQVFGMFADPEHVTDDLVAAAMSGAPLASATDDDGVASTIWALANVSDQRRLAAFMSKRQVFIADGHHRYTTALAYRDERAAEQALTGSPVTGDAPYDTVMMALVNMDDPGLIVRPTHRMVDAAGPFDAAAFRETLARDFELTVPEASDPIGALAASAARPAFLVRTRDGVTVLARLRPDVDHSSAFPAGSSEAWRGLDVAVLQELILSPLLNVHPDRPGTLDRLSFSKDAVATLASFEAHDAVFILNSTRMEQVAAVARGGETMPQKSTYFYPKLLSGLLFKRLDEA